MAVEKRFIIKVAGVGAVFLAAAAFLFFPFLPSLKTSSSLQRALSSKDLSNRILEAYQTIEEGQKILAVYTSFPVALQVAKAYQIIGRPAHAKAFFLYAQNLSARNFAVKEEIKKLNHELKQPYVEHKLYSLRELFVIFFLLAAAFFLYNRECLSSRKNRFIFCFHIFLFFTCLVFGLYELLGRKTLAVILDLTHVEQESLIDSLDQKEAIFFPGEEVLVIDVVQKPFSGYLIQKGSFVLQIPISSAFVLTR